MKKTLFFIILLFASVELSFLYSQNGLYPIEVESVLNKSNNRKELELFLDYSRQTEDSLKWKAACFLVQNMDIHYSDTYKWVDSLGNTVEFEEQNYPNYSLSIEAFKTLQSNKKLKPILSKEYDIHYITTDLLIDNLEKAFDAWAKPQASHLSFDDFCEYILPYRNSTEKLEKWRGIYTERFKPSNAYSKYTNTLEAVELLNKKLLFFENSFSYESKNIPISFLSPSQLLFRKRGYCEDMVNLTLLAFRSQGIPCKMDIVPYHATSTGRHYWNVTIDENHNYLPFEGITNTPNEFILRREPGKVIRVTYAKQNNVVANYVSEDEIPKGFMRSFNYLDVTSSYWPVRDISCQLSEKQKKKVAYIAVLNGLSWRPISWGKIINGKSVSFPDMGCGVAYLPMIYENGRLKPAAYPILLFDNKEVKELRPNKTSTHKIILHEQDKYLKYRPNKIYKLYYWDNSWKLIGEKRAEVGDKSLEFSDVPKEALLLLLPEYSKKKERPFHITSEGERVWW